MIRAFNVYCFTILLPIFFADNIWSFFFFEELERRHWELVLGPYQGCKSRICFIALNLPSPLNPWIMLMRL
jgi:hypothetical protein